ncbi:hypothetical protein DDB_G0269280 [Dictyostelium discoideum AX4]|uniref:Uncharacterized protein n=1 Tax=Dictyostelium discoideum TaxID=44689 RepID=Q55ED7_DICDI|nr:hypothetical protein DDB_G0269280 [Dictyostelium discoideum AX4]EAL71990.1 hypothetical protein DDB_G0269280 [Dictyostelium discoideum AX4]|eukprot:XP_645844.1 hypothetical protein DDB_G0269280 [Dictyostelium discoideum AX4]
MTKDNNNNNNKKDEEEIIIDEEDEFLGIYHLSKEELIDTIRDIREEYFELQEDHNKLEERYKDKLKEIEFNRKLLTEREDLLLQLQWDPNQDTTYFQQMGTSESNQTNELKMKALMDQMRVMERGIFERDEKIKQMEKVIETFTLQQINSGLSPPTQIIYPQFNTIRQQQQQYSSASEPNSTTTTPTAKGSLVDKLSQSSSTVDAGILSTADAPNTFIPISKYPLPREASTLFESSNSPQPSTTVNIVSANQQQQQQSLNRSTSFWQSPKAYVSNLLGLSSNDQISKKDENDKSIDDSESFEIETTKPNVVQSSSAIRV